MLETAPAGAVHACTDITGFGLIGHASEMAAASGCSLEIEAGRLPVLDGARELVAGNNPGGGAHQSRTFRRPASHAAAGLDRVALDLLYDPQTSGGLLIAAETHADSVASALDAGGVSGRPDRRAVSRGAYRILWCSRPATPAGEGEIPRRGLPWRCGGMV